MGSAERALNSFDVPQVPPRLVAAYLDPEGDGLTCAFQDGRVAHLRLRQLHLPASPRVEFALVDEFGAGIDFVREDGSRTSCGADLVLYLIDAAYRASQRKRPRLTDEAMAQRVARCVFRLRREQSLSQRDLARRLGIAPPNLARIEKGRNLPSVATLHRLSQALACTLADLIGI
jgi:DNA-binding XRE family transcriptional regulator